MHDAKGLKLSINLELPTEREYEMPLEERIEDAAERLEFGHCTDSYKLLRRVNECLVKCWKAGKRSDRLSDLLGLVTPLMMKHGLEDVKGLEVIEEFVTNSDYRENQEDE